MAQTNTNFPRGSEWRRWDLHVHSPASANFHGNWDEYIIQLGGSDCALIGINDYFSVAGYKEVRRRLDSPAPTELQNPEYADALNKLRTKALLPVIECRMTNVVVGKKGSGPRINFHIIFSDAINSDDIEALVKSFEVKDTTIGSNYANSNFLLNEAAVDFNSVRKRLSTDKRFQGKYAIWIPYDEYGGIGDIDPKTDKLFKEGLVSAADILGSSSKKQADFFLWKDTRYAVEDYAAWFGKRKPCIKGSDSHNVKEAIGRLKDQDSKPTDRSCWIKADPTFLGLMQIVNEPGDRVFIGTEPPKLSWVKSHPTYFLSSVRLKKVADSTLQDIWFDSDIPLNHDMIAIIGNKGSGKSALADILALAGDTTQSEHFSFLQKKKFREKKLASNFEIVATWENGTTATHNLQNNPDPNKPESIKYISQSYLEHVCTETSPDEGSDFQRELRNVIFSHISPEQKLGRSSLEELIAYKTEEVNSEIDRLRTEISQCNATISSLESKATQDYSKQIEELLSKKKLELEAHDAAKPVEVAKPDSLSDEQKAAYAAVEAELTAQHSSLQSIDAQLKIARTRYQTLTEHLSLAVKLESRLTNIEADIASQKQQSFPSFTALGLAPDEAIKLSINRKPLLAKKAEIETEKAKLDLILATEGPDSLSLQQASIKSQIEQLKAQLDAPSKQYQDFLSQLAAWQNRRDEIVGSQSEAESLQYYEGVKQYLVEQLPHDILIAREKRKALALKVHASTAAIRDVYAELFAPVQKLIAETVIIKEGFKLTFVSAIIQRGFRREFFEKFINQGVNGSFCGKEPGEVRLSELVDDVDFNDPVQAVEFVEKIEKHLFTDFRSSKKFAMQPVEQLRKHTTVASLYDFLWSFSYLVPEYSLKLDGKDLNLLSPGERGALLLVFYLLVDRSDMPIIVDQPEENLDNQTVYFLLIPVIKKVKAKRQIIMVTHNPNIAVVCDAEQVIHASIDRPNGNRIRYQPGSIENPATNLNVIDVLEGTRPAFDNRDGKYHRV